jgi:hypothetical protein
MNQDPKGTLASIRSRLTLLMQLNQGRIPSDVLKDLGGIREALGDLLQDMLDARPSGQGGR